MTSTNTPKILIIPGWLDSTNCYAEQIMRYAGKHFYFEKDYYENVDTSRFDLFFPLYATVGTPDNVPQHKIVKVIYEAHECHGVHPDNPLVGGTYKYVVDFSKDWLQRDKVMVLEFGIDTELFKPLPLKREDDLFHIGFVGGITNQRKMFPEVVEPLKNIKGSKLMISSSWEGTVIRQWHGMPNFYNQLDVLVIGSAAEGFCLPFLEAASCGLPIVSTDVGAIKEFPGKLVVKRKMNGHIMENTGDVLNELKTHLEYLRDHPKERKAMGQANREEVLKNWTWEKKIGNYIKFFKEGLKRSKAWEQKKS